MVCSYASVANQKRGRARPIHMRPVQHNITSISNGRRMNPKSSKVKRAGVVLVCGPSGVGKSTLVKELMTNDKFSHTLGLVVSHTTRKPRQGEVDGVHYHFVSHSKMEEMIRGGLFLEYAEVHGNLYGTSFEAVDAVQSRGKTCILDVDLQGVQSIRRYLAENHASSLQAAFVLVLPDDGLKTLEHRLRSRSSESEESIQRRLETSAHERAQYQKHEWCKIIVNEDGNLAASATALEKFLHDFCTTSTT